MDTKNKVMPRHIAIIMDGNGRWAKERGLERFEGHREGARAFRRIVDHAADLGIEYITFYAFSTENWKRPSNEVSAIMDLFREYLCESLEKKSESRESRVHFLGSREGLAPDIIELMEQSEEETKDAKGTVVNLAINYGGRNELVSAVKSIAEKVKSGEISADEITDEAVSAELYTAGQPDPDLIIRPSGEYRLSNFLIWQSAYSEFLFSNVLWPDFTVEDFDKALEEYARRNRRYGGI